MAAFATEKALLLIDFINEIVDLKGKSAGKGYTDFDARHGSLDRVSSLLNHARNNGFAVIHVGVGFSPDYKEQPEASPLFGGAKKLALSELVVVKTYIESMMRREGGQSCANSPFRAM